MNNSNIQIEGLGPIKDLAVLRTEFSMVRKFYHTMLTNYTSRFSISDNFIQWIISAISIYMISNEIGN